MSGAIFFSYLLFHCYYRISSTSLNVTFVWFSFVATNSKVAVLQVDLINY